MDGAQKPFKMSKSDLRDALYERYGQTAEYVTAEAGSRPAVYLRFTQGQLKLNLGVIASDFTISYSFSKNSSAVTDSSVYSLVMLLERGAIPYMTSALNGLRCVADETRADEFTAPCIEDLFRIIDTLLQMLSIHPAHIAEPYLYSLKTINAEELISMAKSDPISYTDPNSFKLSSLSKEILAMWREAEVIRYAISSIARLLLT